MNGKFIGQGYADFLRRASFEEAHQNSTDLAMTANRLLGIK